MRIGHLLIGAAAMLFGASQSLAQAPTNDDCSGAIPVTVGVTPFDSTLATDGTGLPLDPMVCDPGIFGDDQLYQDVWFTFAVPSNDNFDIVAIANALTGTAFDSRIAIYDQATCPDDPANVIACNDDLNGLQAGVLDLPLTMGTTYTIRVGSYNPFTAEQPAELDIAVNAPPAGVPNDDCVTAVSVVEGNTPFDNTMAANGTALPMDPLVCDMGAFGDEQIYADVWFSFMPAASGTFDVLSINNGNMPFDSRIAVYDQSTCPSDPNNVIGCNDDVNMAFEAGITNLLLSSTSTYLIRVGSYDIGTVAQPAELSIVLTGPPPTPPVNDDCSTATVAMLGLNAMDTINATNGTGLPMDPMVCSLGGNEQIFADAWWSFTAPATDTYDIAVVNNFNPTWDSSLAVYDQSTCPDDPANVIACDDDSGVGLEPLIANLPLTMGQTILIRAGSLNPTTIEELAALSIIASPPPPANDDCANAEAINAYGTYPFDNSFATTDGADLTGICDFSLIATSADTIERDVWFEFTAPQSGCTYISTLGFAGFDTKLAVYDSNSCPEDPMSVLACSDDESQPIAVPFEAGLDVDLTAGSTYLIRVGNFSAITIGGAASLFISAGPMANLSDMGMQPGAPGCSALPVYADSCSGDGGNQMGCSDCPCGNNNPVPGTVGGCLNSAGTSTRLIASGDASLSLGDGATTDLRFTATGAPPMSTNVLLSGNAVAPQNMGNPCFGLDSGALAGDRDGLRCAVQSVARHGNRAANAMGEIMDSTGPNRVWGGEAQPAPGIGVQGGFVAGQTRYFQITHRDDALQVCMRGLNTSQAVEVTFTP